MQNGLNLAGASLPATLVAAAVLFASPANAGADRISFEVVGKITARCGLTQSQPSGELGDILDQRSGGATQRSVELDFNLDCNSPFRLSLASAGGGLAAEAPELADSPGFRRLVDYRTSLKLAELVLDCKSDDMAAGKTRGSERCQAEGDKALHGAGKIRVDVVTDARPLLGGRYRDQLILRVTPVLGGEDGGPHTK